MRAMLRFVGAVLATTGALAIAETVITLAWQEPVSAFLAGRSQNALEDELGAAERAAASDARFGVAERAARYRRRLDPGDAAGRIVLPSLNRSYVFVESTGTSELRDGPGHYPDTPLPGERGTVAIAGHRTTYGAPFRTIDRLKRGHSIRVEMPYGDFRYRVEHKRTVKPTDVSVKRRVAFDRLILTACHPLYSARERIVVFARLEPSATEPSSRDSKNKTSPISSTRETARTTSQ